MNIKDSRRKKSVFPGIPVEQVIYEATCLIRDSLADRRKLESGGLDNNVLEKLQELIDDCSVAQAKWEVYKKMSVGKTASLLKFEKECRALRSLLLDKIRVSYN